jgi:TPR repeat protein
MRVAKGFSVLAGQRKLPRVKGLIVLITVYAVLASNDARAQGGASATSPWSTATVEQLTGGAQRGDPAAAYGLGMKYWLGDGVRKDVKAAVVWFSRAAAKDYAPADAALGVIYEEGEGVAADAGEAAHFYHRGAELGDALSQYRLGLLLTKGRGVERNYTEAAFWYKAAADQGFPDAQNNLGYLFAAGLGVPQNLQMARSWYEKAAAAGNEAAKENLAKLEANASAAALPQTSPQAAAPPGPARQTGAPDTSAPARPAAPEEIWTALLGTKIQPKDLPEGFSAPRAQEQAAVPTADRPTHELKVSVSHAAGAHWYSYRVYASVEGARAAYADFAANAGAQLPQTTRLRPFSISRLIDDRPYIFKCIQSFPVGDPDDHTVECAYDEPDLPVIFAAGAAARYKDAEYPPDALYQRLTDLIAFARARSQPALMTRADKF